LQEFSELGYHYYMLSAQDVLYTQVQYHGIWMQDPKMEIVGPFL